MSAQPNQSHDDQPERRRPFSTLLSSLTPHADDDRDAAAADEDATVADEHTGVTDEHTGVAPQPTFTAREDLPAAPPVSQPATAADLDPVDGTEYEPVTGTVYEADAPVDDELTDDKPVRVESGVVESEVVTDEADDDPADLDDPLNAATVPPAPRASGEALPGFRRASTDVDGARGFPRHAAPDEVDELVPADEVVPAASAMPSTSASMVDEPLLSDSADFRARWQQAQAAFVDDPREAVGEAADLIEQTAQALVAAVRQRQRQLRESWDHTPEVHGTEPVNMADTEQLRLMMQRYRALFNQLCRP